ncbi:MAG: hypothetical protein E7598_04575 [Ruminococcaceae bacterium]|nr:hypothetical protein [Oscillospiraceae bacterium]
MKNAYIDFHCHILPGMDFDGTDDVNESVAMCKALKSQGVATICATPHFYPWNDDVDEFLKRRSETLNKLLKKGVDIEIIPGAEVQIFQSLTEYRVDRMCIGDSRVIMFEIPMRPFENWMISAIENAVYKYSLIPIIAHIERYGFSQEVLRKFAELPNVIFQITVGELSYKRAINTLDMISSFGVPVILGTDAHDMTSRTPNFDLVSKKLSEKPGLFGKTLKKTQAIIENCLYAQADIEKLIRTPKVVEVK